MEADRSPLKSGGVILPEPETFAQRGNAGDGATWSSTTPQHLARFRGLSPVRQQTPEGGQPSLSSPLPQGDPSYHAGGHEALQAVLKQSAAVLSQWEEVNSNLQHYATATSLKKSSVSRSTNETAGMAPPHLGEGAENSSEPSGAKDGHAGNTSRETEKEEDEEERTRGAAARAADNFVIARHNTTLARDTSTTLARDSTAMENEGSAGNVEAAGGVVDSVLRKSTEILNTWEQVSKAHRRAEGEQGGVASSAPGETQRAEERVQWDRTLRQNTDGGAFSGADSAVSLPVERSVQIAETALHAERARGAVGDDAGRSELLALNAGDGQNWAPRKRENGLVLYTEERWAGAREERRMEIQRNENGGDEQKSLLEQLNSALLSHGFQPLSRNGLRGGSFPDEEQGGRVLCEVVERFEDVLKQFGRRGKLVQELLLSADKATERECMLKVQGLKAEKETALLREQVARLSSPSKSLHNLSESPDLNGHGHGKAEEAERSLQAAGKQGADVEERRTDQGLTVWQEAHRGGQSGAMNSGNSGDDRGGARRKWREREEDGTSRLEDELEKRLRQGEDLARRERETRRLVQELQARLSDKERELERCQARILGLIEEEESKRRCSKEVLRVFRKGGKGGGGAGLDTRAAGALNLLLGELQEVEDEVSKVRVHSVQLTEQLKDALNARSVPYSPIPMEGVAHGSRSSDLVIEDLRTKLAEERRKFEGAAADLHRKVETAEAERQREEAKARAAEQGRVELLDKVRVLEEEVAASPLRSEMSAMEAELCRMEVRMEAAEDERADMTTTMEQLCDMLNVHDRSNLCVAARRLQEAARDSETMEQFARDTAAVMLAHPAGHKHTPPRPSAQVLEEVLRRVVAMKEEVSKQRGRWEERERETAQFVGALNRCLGQRVRGGELSGKDVMGRIVEQVAELVEAEKKLKGGKAEAVAEMNYSRSTVSHAISSSPGEAVDASMEPDSNTSADADGLQDGHRDDMNAARGPETVTYHVLAVGGHRSSSDDGDAGGGGESRQIDGRGGRARALEEMVGALKEKWAKMNAEGGGRAKAREAEREREAAEQMEEEERERRALDAELKRREQEKESARKEKRRKETERQAELEERRRRGVREGRETKRGVAWSVVLDKEKAGKRGNGAGRDREHASPHSSISPPQQKRDRDPAREERGAAVVVKRGWDPLRGGQVPVHTVHQAMPNDDDDDDDDADARARRLAGELQEAYGKHRRMMTRVRGGGREHRDNATDAVRSPGDSDLSPQSRDLVTRSWDSVPQSRDRVPGTGLPRTARDLSGQSRDMRTRTMPSRDLSEAKPRSRNGGNVRGASGKVSHDDAPKPAEGDRRIPREPGSGRPRNPSQNRGAGHARMLGAIVITAATQGSAKGDDGREERGLLPSSEEGQVRGEGGGRETGAGHGVKGGVEKEGAGRLWDSQEREGGVNSVGGEGGRRAQDLGSEDDAGGKRATVGSEGAGGVGSEGEGGDWAVEEARFAARLIRERVHLETEMRERRDEGRTEDGEAHDHAEDGAGLHSDGRGGGAASDRTRVGAVRDDGLRMERPSAPSEPSTDQNQPRKSRTSYV